LVETGLPNSPMMLSKGLSLVHLVTCSELGAAVCTMVGITSEEDDASESFYRIEMPKNGSLFIYGASRSTVVEECKPVEAAGSRATASTIGAITLGAGYNNPKFSSM
nr:hypothetical protein [Tanacetum cinerariifolium]